MHDVQSHSVCHVFLPRPPYKYAGVMLLQEFRARERVQASTAQAHDEKSEIEARLHLRDGSKAGAPSCVAFKTCFDCLSHSETKKTKKRSVLDRVSKLVSKVRRAFRRKTTLAPGAGAGKGDVGGKNDGPGGNFQKTDETQKEEEAERLRGEAHDVMTKRMVDGTECVWHPASGCQRASGEIADEEPALQERGKCPLPTCN